MPAATVVNERTRLPLGLVATLCTIVAAGAAAWGVAQYRINDLSAKAERAEGLERRLQRVEDSYPEIKEALKEIRTELREIRHAR